MSDWKLNLYHRLPPLLRNAAASARGRQLQRRRYGPETDRLVEEALARDAWPRHRLQAWQRDRLDAVLRRAVHRVPFYRDYWKGRSGWERLENWPVLKKESVRKFPEAFVADDCPIRQLHYDHTSGTTGSPLRIWSSQATLRRWYALFEARWRRWYGLSRHQNWAMLGGQLVVPASQQKPPFWVWNSGMNQLYLSSYHLRAQNTGAYLQALADHRIEYIWGYASSLFSLARFAAERSLPAPSLKAAISNAEPFLAHQREVISKVFNCPTHDTYGMAEMVAGASECDQGSFHLWPEAGVVEILEDAYDAPAPAESTGRLLCTGLISDEMFLIRYEIGDRAALAAADEPCACGRTLPVLRRLEGRNDDVLITRDGRRIGRLDPVFKGDMPLLEAQIVQDSFDLIRVRLIPAKGFNEAWAEAIRQRIRDRVGDIEVRVELVDSIPRSANGKFRAVLSTMKPSAAACLAE